MIGKIKLHKLILDKDAEPDWHQSWNVSRDFNIENWTEANLRTLFDDEIVLDYEDKVIAMIEEDRVKRLGYTYYVWESGSRGIHINIYIPRLASLDEKTRMKYRELFINKHNGDKSKKTGWLALEWRPHFKTGNIKRLVRKHTANSELDMDLLIQAKKMVAEETREFSKKINNFNNDILTLAKKWGFVEMGRSGDEVFGFFEVSSRKKHLWINTKKQVFFDFHRWEGGGTYQLYKLIKRGE